MVPRAYVVAIVLLVSVAAAGASAQAATRPRPPIVTRNTPVAGGSTYLSLGDSVTFGYMEPGVVPAPDYHNPASFLGYPEQLGAQLHLRVVNPACPGETSASLINASALSNGCENAYRKAYPLHVSYAGSQLAYAVAFLRRNRNVRLVSLMIGANDLFICQRMTSDSCLKASEQNALFAQVSANVRRILSAVLNQARYRGQLAIIKYYSLDYSSPVINTVTTWNDAHLVAVGGLFANAWHGVAYPEIASMAGASRAGTALGLFTAYLALANGVLAVFTLVPVYPMDAARVLLALLWRLRADRPAPTVPLWAGC